MAQTVNSGDASYCTAQQMIYLGCDVRVLGDLLTDAGTRLTEAQVLASTILDEHLKAASGRLESSCLIGERYDPADLAALAASDTNGQRHLATVVAGLALDSLVKRRRIALPAEMEAMRADSLATLQQLRDGERIFPFSEAQDAGLNETTIETEAIVDARRMSTTYAARFYGRRTNRDDR